MSVLKSDDKCTFVATSNYVKTNPVWSKRLANGTDLQSKIIANNGTFQIKGGQIVQSSSVKEPNSKISPATYGFISSVLNAYNGHHNLVLRPDDVWHAILIQFSFYVNANAETLRDKFVKEKQLEVEIPGSLFTVDVDTFARKMVNELMSKNLKDATVTEFLIPKFTTTTDTDRIVAAISVVSKLQAHFKYKSSSACGIPEVTLLGTVQDWRNLRSKIDRLPQYEVTDYHDGPVMTKWHGLLKRVLNGFVSSAEGNPDLYFWDKVASTKSCPSGSPYLSGWLTVFACFKSDGEWQGEFIKYGRQWPRIDIDSIPLGTVSVPVTIRDNRAVYDSTMTAGQFCFGVTGDALDTIQPRSDWCISITD